MVEDKISNLINGIKNAQKTGKDTLQVSHTKFVMSVLDLLKREGFVSDVEKSGKGIAKHVDVSLKYDEETGVPAITDFKRVSKQSKRVYKSVNEIHPIRNGYGTLILSTPDGLMTDKQAKKANVGGEALFEIW